MYLYDEFNRHLVEQRVAQFKEQTRRFLGGELSEEEFRPLRLQNGLCIQRHAPMLRVAIPYGMLVARQLRMLAHVARRWDKGYAHLSTRQNVQFNWPRMEDVPHILADLADAHGHGGLRISHEQNLILADVRKGGLFTLWRELEVLKLASLAARRRPAAPAARTGARCRAPGSAPRRRWP